MNARKPRTVPTLKDVAEAAEVSLTTASRSLHPTGRHVNPETRARVEAAAQRLSYVPNLTARAMARGTTAVVALVVGNISDPYFSSISAGVVAEAGASDLIVAMSATQNDPRHEVELVRSLKAQRPRAIILTTSRGTDDEVNEQLSAELSSYEASGGRVAVIGRSELPFPAIEPNNREGAEALARALVNLGYRRFGIITGPHALITGVDRAEGFCAGVEASGFSVPPHRIRHESFDREGGYAGAQALLRRTSGDLDLIFASTDAMALGALSAIRDAGLVPGSDVALAGFDDIPNITDVTPALSTVRVPLEELGRRALRTALWMPTGSHHIPVSTQVVLRDSTPERSAS